MSIQIDVIDVDDNMVQHVINNIDKPVVQFEEYQIRLYTGSTATIPGPHKWLPVRIEAEESVLEDIIRKPRCTVQYVIDGINYELSNVWVTTDQYLVYYNASITNISDII